MIPLMKVASICNVKVIEMRWITCFKVGGLVFLLSSLLISRELLNPFEKVHDVKLKKNEEAKDHLKVEPEKKTEISIRLKEDIEGRK